MTPVQEIKMVTSRREAVVDTITGIASLAAAYYMLHPTTLDQHMEIARSYWERICSKVSVWQALGAIRSLPETRD